MTLSIAGMSSSLALKLLDATQTQEKTLIRTDPANARAIAGFLKDAPGITTAKDFVGSYTVYSLVMQAFDLKDQMFGKAMVRQILESDATQSGALVNRMADARFTNLYNTLGFTNGGTANTTFASPDWQNRMIQKFVDQQYINDEKTQNAAVGIALEFRQNAPDVKTWYDILKNKDMGSFMRSVLGLPDSVATLDLTRQVALFTQKYDITKLQDPAEVQKLVQKYAVLSDSANAAASAAQNPAVVMLNATLSGADGSYVPATLDISSIDVSALSAAKLYG